MLIDQPYVNYLFMKYLKVFKRKNKLQYSTRELTDKFIMAYSTVVVAFIISLVYLAHGETCTSPTASVLTYTSRNIALATETDYIAEFTVSCQEESHRLNLYAEIESGVLVSVAYNDQNNQYQVSWAKPHEKAIIGKIPVKIFNNEGVGAYRKAQRNNEDVNEVAPFLTINIHHPGVSREGLFVQTEFLAVVSALFIWWVANSMRSQIME